MRSRVTNIAGGGAAVILACVASYAVVNVARSGTAEKNRRVDSARVLTDGDPNVGRDIIMQTGCGACHLIPGINAARGQVGPSLQGFAQRAVVGGVVPNTPENLERWLQNPRAVNPSTAMPDLGLSSTQTRAIAAYLYTNAN
jgi:cytochrome c2